MPDYGRKKPKEPVATIRMTTKSQVYGGEGDLGDDARMRSRVDPVKYLALLLGSNVSLTESVSSLRLQSPHRPSYPLLQELSDNQLFGELDEFSGVWNLARQQQHPNRAEQNSNRTEQKNNRTQNTIRTGPLLSANGRKLTLSRDPPYKPNSSVSALLPSVSSIKRTHSYEIDGEIDADATIVDADAVLDQGSDLVLERSRAMQRLDNTPLPTPDTLSRRQLRLIGTTVDSTSTSTSNTNVDDALSQLVLSEHRSDSADNREISSCDLYDLVGSVGESMLVNRARLLLIQQETQYNLDRSISTALGLSKPPSAPCGLIRSSPLQSALTIDSMSSSATERATTAPQVRAKSRIRGIKSSKLRSGSGCGSWSVPCKDEAKARAGNLRQPFIVQSFNPSRKRTPHVPRTSLSSRTSSASTLKTTTSSNSAFLTPALSRTSLSRRCAKYRDPLGEVRGYGPLSDKENRSLSETPLLHEHFSSLSSFLPSSSDIVK